MKQIITFFAILLMAVSVYAQAPQEFSYQAVVRNNSGVIIANQAVTFRISLLQGSATGTAIYSEIQGVTTNEYGLVNFQIGKGTVTSGTFSSINWGGATFFAKVELDINGGSNFIEMSTSQLLSVPYALHATTASSVTEGLKVTPRIASRYNYNPVAVSFTGGTEVTFSQASACPAVQATVVLRMTQGTRTYSATPTSIFYIDSKRFDALFDLYYFPSGLYDIIIGSGSCPIQLNSAFKIY